MNENFMIEQASVDDLQQVRSLLELVDLPIEGVDNHIEHFLIARVDTENSTAHSIIGSIGLEIYDTFAVLRSLAVHPRYRNRVLGNKLVSRLTEYGKKSGVKKLFLLTTTAEKYFETRGFNLTDRETVPQAIRNSPEFSSICPSTAFCFSKSIG
jgi:amino-acid N-acetyltransferase